MPETYKILGQVAPLAGVLTDAYVVPASRSAVLSSIVVCNTGVSGSDAFVRVSVSIAGTAFVNAQSLIFDELIKKNTTLPILIGPTLATTDVVRVQSDQTDVAFNVFGTEIT